MYLFCTLAYLLHLSDKNAALMVSGYQYVGLQNLIQRNEQLFSSENAPSGGVSLPFILVQVYVLPILFDVVWPYLFFGTLW